MWGNETKVMGQQGVQEKAGGEQKARSVYNTHSVDHPVRANGGISGGHRKKEGRYIP